VLQCVHEAFFQAGHAVLQCVDEAFFFGGGRVGLGKRYRILVRVPCHHSRLRATGTLLLLES
jgi:hypothetical protein